MTAPAAVPSVEDVARAIAQNPPNRSWEEHKDSMRLARDHLPTARAVLDLFAPILAEKELHHVTGERITRKDLNNAYREGSEKGRLAAHLIDGIDSPLNACCYRDQCKAMEARALAAEAALAAERERCIAIVDAQVPDWVKERSGPYWEGYRDAMEDAAEDMRKGPRCG